MADSPLSIIKSYLVSLGFSVDKSSFESATNAIDSVKSGLAKFAGDSVKNFGIAAGSVTAFFATAAVGMAKFLGDLGNAQIQYEMLSRQLWTTQQNAEAFSTTLKAMGRNLNDLYLSPTLMAQFQQLNKQAFEMMPPAEYNQQMQLIQGITFQFTRMKLEATYALQWIGYYLIKYMSGPINNIYYFLTHVNDLIIKDMPYWTKVVALVMSWFAQFGVTTVEALKSVIDVFIKAGQLIPSNMRLIAMAIGAFIALFVADNPIAWIVAGIVALGLAINDLETYLHGGQSEFPKFWAAVVQGWKDVKNWAEQAWQKVKDFWQVLKDNGTVADWKKTAKDIGQIFKQLGKDIGVSLANLGSEVDKSGVLNSIGQDLITMLKNLSDIVTTIADIGTGIQGWQPGIKQAGDWINTYIVKSLQTVDDLLKAINAILSIMPGGIKQISDWINNYWVKSLQTVNTLVKQIMDIFKAIGDGLSGNWGQFFNDIKKFVGDTTSGMSKQSYVYPSSNNTNTSSKMNVNVNQNIYGSSDPNATGNAATSSLTTIMRQNRGVIA